MNLDKVCRTTREQVILLDGVSLPLPRGGFETLNRAIIDRARVADCLDKAGLTPKVENRPDRIRKARDLWILGFSHFFPRLPRFAENRQRDGGMIEVSIIVRGESEGAMKRGWKWEPGENWPRLCLVVGVVLVLLTFLTPLLFLDPEEPTPRETPTPLPTATLPLMSAGAEPVVGWDEGQSLRFMALNGEVEEVTMEEYLWGVVAAEMPAIFDLEALKAQTVAARTYAFRQKSLGVDKHTQADVCGDYTCCQAYLTREQARENWGEDAPVYEEKITRAVSDTDGLLCLYQGEPIDALFFSSAAGVTSAAVEVWGAEIPYLHSVESPEGAEVPGWQTLVTFTRSEFADRFRESWPQADFEGEPGEWFSRPTLDSSGAVATITIGGVEVTGFQARQALGLRSAHFTVEPTGENILIHVTGYGHGVGMSQYGANALAGEGKNFEEILKWYYTGVTVEGIP